MPSRFFFIILVVLVGIWGSFWRLQKKSYYLQKCRQGSLDDCYWHCVWGSLRGAVEECETRIEEHVGAEL